MAMRTVGIDLSINGRHKAIVADESGRFITPLLTFHTDPSELDRLLARASVGAEAASLQVIMEPTGMAWFPIAAYLTQRAIPVYLAQGQQVADLRRFYSRHAKSDLVDAQVLARLAGVNQEHLHRLILPPAEGFACQRACKQLDRLITHITSIGNRIQAIDRFAWPRLEQRVFSQPFSPAARWFREHWYHPGSVIQADAEAIRQAWVASQLDVHDPGEWSEALVKLAIDVLRLYGDDAAYLDFDQLQAEVAREQQVMHQLETMAHALRLKTMRPLYRQIHPDRRLETLFGVGQDSAAVYASLVSEPTRFSTSRAFRGWSGMVPSSRQSADSETQGLHITQAGPSLIKKFAYLDADVARQRDPQIAAIYYRQMVERGKHHKQAVCACATHMLDRVRAVLRDGRPYELRDVDGTPVTPEEARAIIAARYTVPPEVRQRRNKHKRRERADQQAERKQVRESHPS